MTKKQPTRASQTTKSGSTKVETQASKVKPKTQNKVWTPPSYLDTPNAPKDTDTDGSGLKLWGLPIQKTYKDA